MITFSTMNCDPDHRGRLMPPLEFPIGHSSSMAERRQVDLACLGSKAALRRSDPLLLRCRAHRDLISMWRFVYW